MPQPPETALPIRGIYETHLTVASLPRALEFYHGKLGLPVARELPERGAAFLWAGAPDTAMLGLWETGSAPMGMRLHFAFSMAAGDIRTLPPKLQQAGIAPLGFHGEHSSEPVVIGWMPALSLYCKDPDGHSVEFIAKLPDAADPDFGVGPLSAWEKRHG